MEQLVQPNLTVKGTAGWCLWYAQEVFGVPHLYNTAWECYQATQFKHTDAIPNNSVPVWFSGANGMGHVAVSTPQGIYSSPYNDKTDFAVFQTIQELESVYGCKYVGWSEDISGIRIVKGVDMTKKEAQQLSLYMRLSAGQTEKQAADNSDYDVEHILADSSYAASMAKQIFDGKDNEMFRYKASHYDADVANGQFIKVTDLYIKKG